MPNSIILIVEDNAVCCKVISTFIKSMGYTYFAVSCATEGLKILEQGKFDLILLDINLPDMDGFEFTKTIREKGISIPVILCSAFSCKDNFMQDNLHVLHLKDCLTKPIDREDLKYLIEQYIGPPK